MREFCRPAWMGEMLQVSAHEAHSRHSLASLSLHHGNIHHTLFTPLYEAGKHGNQRGNVYVSVCVCVCIKKGEGGMQICSCCQLSNKDLHKPQKSPDCLLSAGSSGTVLPLWVPLFPVGLHRVSQWRPLESPLLWLHQILLKPTNDWDYTVASSPSPHSASHVQQHPAVEFSAPVIIIIIKFKCWNKFPSKRKKATSSTL